MVYRYHLILSSITPAPATENLQIINNIFPYLLYCKHSKGGDKNYKSKSCNIGTDWSESALSIMPSIIFKTFPYHEMENTKPDDGAVHMKRDSMGLCPNIQLLCQNKCIQIYLNTFFTIVNICIHSEFYCHFNHIYVISSWWKGVNEKLWTMGLCLWLKRILHQAGF